MSVVTTQIKSIQNALQANATIFQFEGRETVLNRRVGYFITMNPGYAGRTELPESLKALFRPVVVIVPDLEYICEIMLFSQGFLTARLGVLPRLLCSTFVPAFGMHFQIRVNLSQKAEELAKKLTTMYRLAKEQLSQQYHYDFGLRALRSVLGMAGNIRRADPDCREDILLMRALKDTNLPKFVHEDVPLFLGLVQDLFPGVELVLQSSAPELVVAVNAVMKHQRYFVVEEQVQKIIQLRDTLAVRHSVMLVGPTLGGKSVVLNTLANAQKIRRSAVPKYNNALIKRPIKFGNICSLGINTKLHVINPKDRTVNELYGILDPASREWTDGLLSLIFRNINQPTDQNERRYLVFDGDVDALWIENMNSVMDDNKLLTLVNGERIKLMPHCALLFEVGDLKYASPATVSRCGMVYVDPKNLPYTAYWEAWLDSLGSAELRSALWVHFRKFVPPLMDLIFEGIMPRGAPGRGGGGKQDADEDSDHSVGGGGATGGGGGGAGGSTPSGPMPQVIPTSSMHTMIQFCSLLGGQFDDGAPPGTDNPGSLPSLSSAVNQAQRDSSAELLKKVLAQQEVPEEGDRPGVKPPPSPAPSAATTVTEMKTEKLGFDTPEVIEAIFMHCLLWTMAGPLKLEDQYTVDEAIKMLSGLPNLDEGEGMPSVNPGVIPSHYPHLLDYMFDLEEFKWVCWRRLVPEYVYRNDLPYPEILVPTVETVRLEWILKENFLPFTARLTPNTISVSQLNRPILIVGDTGTSKTATALATIQSLNPETTTSLVINFSSRTTAKDVLRSLNANVEKRSKGVYGPMPGKKLIVFIDDLNMPQEDTYGTQQPIALMRMILGRGGLFEQGKDLVWRSLKDMTYMGGMGPPGGGRRSLDPRFVSFFSLFYCLQPSADSLTKIFGSIISGYFSNGFSKKLQSMVEGLTQMSIESYFAIKEKMLPTPAKFHYTFNLRDISRLFQGMCQATPDRFKGPKKILRLWRHEALRSYYDRLINDVDRSTVMGILHETMEKYFPGDIAYALMDPLIFGDYWSAGLEEEAKFYEDIQDYDVCKAVAEELLLAYNETEGTMDLVLFNDALAHLSIIHRILRLEGSHALLVGVSGSGKKVLAKLAAFIAGLSPFEISLSKSYGMQEFCEDLKSLYSGMAENKKQYMFLFADNHVREEGFLELINNILTTGALVALFSEEDKDGIINNVWPTAEAAIKAIGGATASVTKESVWKWFHKNCTARLHLALCMSPVGDNLRNRCRNFPGLVNCTTIDWFFPWPEQALFAVACSLIDPKSGVVPRRHWESIITNIVSMHMLVEEESLEFRRQLRRDNYVTATNYIGFIQGYKALLLDKNEENVQGQNRLKVGLEKLQETAKQIDELKVKMAVQKVVLEEKTKSCEVLLVEIEESTKTGTAKKTEAQAKSVEVAAQQKVITKEKGEAEEALAEAMPALEAAKRALDELDKNDVTEIRAFATPPKPVQMVGEALCFVMQASDSSWKSARGLMADAGFINTLQSLDAEAIPQKNINAIKDLLQKKGYKYEDVRSASKAGGGFFKFILSVVSFYDVAKEIRPKRERVKMLEKELMKAKRELQKLTDEVAYLEEMLLNLRRQYAEAQNEMERLRNDMNIMLRQLLAAEKLTSGLASEKIRWIQTVASLQKNKVNLVGHCLLASAFLNYLGPFTQEFRTRLYKRWLDGLIIPLQEAFKLNELLTSEVEISLWNSQGLPPDELSIQNAILTTKGPKTPICIDPQGQATKWIRMMELNPKDETRSIKITTLNDPNFLRTLENCVKFGVAIMFTSVEENIDPVLDNILSRNIKKEKGREVIMLGDREVEYDWGFRLYLTSKLPNPKFSANLFSRATIINYTVTTTGLEGQLLSTLVKFEQRELEEKRETLIQETSENKRILKELEDRLLLELATQTGNILDNWELINTLEDTKAKAVEVAKALELAAVVSVDIDRQRNLYRPAARRGAILFFILADLSMVGPMYQFSLSAFIQVFVKALKKAMPNSSLPKRLANIKNSLTYLVFSYGCTALFEDHKLLLSFQLAIRMEQEEKKLRPKELNYFVRGNLALTDEHFTPPYSWIPEPTWRDILYLAAFLPNKFGKLPYDVVKHPDAWKEVSFGADASDWYDSETPEVNDIPGRFNKLASFSRLCLVRVWRTDRVPAGITKFIFDAMGKSFVSPPMTALGDVLASTSPVIPIVLIVQPGSDPPAALTALAQSVDFSVNKIKYLSLGQGQEPVAEALFASCMARGHWLVLQNCHLLLSYTSRLEKMLEDAVKPHPDFRLWATTELINNFPVGLLQAAYKVTVHFSSNFNLLQGYLARSSLVVMQPPSGLRQNIQASLNKLDDAQFVASSHSKYRPIMFVLIFLHGILQERRRYGKLGWNVSYDFADSDLLVSLLILQKSLNEIDEKAEIKWATIKYLIGEVGHLTRCTNNCLETRGMVMYGGRTIDNYDRRVLTTYMEEYFGDFLFDEFQTFHFYHDETIDYMIPLEPEGCEDFREMYLEAIENWPVQQRPNVFGLHENTAIGYSARFARQLWVCLQRLLPETELVTGIPDAQQMSAVSKDVADFVEKLKTSVSEQTPTDQNAPASEAPAETEEDSLATPRDDLDDEVEEEEEEGTKEGSDDAQKEDSKKPSSSDTSSKDAVVDAMAVSILGRLPPLFDVTALRKKYMGSEISPTTVVLIQELDRFNLILKEMSSSLSELRRAIAGEVGMSAELDDVSACLGSGTIPASWRRLVPATEKSLADWLQQLLMRNDQYKKWIGCGKSEPATMWLSGLHLPQSYLTALIQKACRKNGWALDKCTMSTFVTDILPEEAHTILMAPDLGCNVVGLYLEGSAWSVEENSLTHQQPRQLLQEMPVIRLTPIERHKLKLTGTVDLPVYVNSSRRNAMGQGFVVHLDIPTKEHASHWILEGACIILNTD
ncbi:unnamed protein product [Schistocephalus solidus]|uniref:Dynein heavy chain 10 n=1 Tax=Schistocephalus solidus TaxID=70667 RepID=A0A3P7C0X4_SCHSO|nr:unnamed protein product [Schistocephalus solidus]